MRCRSSLATSAMGDNAGVWEETPQPRPEFRERYRKQMDALAKKRSSGDTSDFKNARMI